MQVAALTFGQEIVKTLIGALAAALFVVAAGWFAADRWSRARDVKRLRAEKEFDLRAELVERATAEAGRMYIRCQHARRVIKENPQGGGLGRISTSLDDAYLSFHEKSQALENLIGARYGVAWRLENGGPPSPPFLRWHQVSDLLTLYYFNLRGAFPGDALERNSRENDGRYHSGLDASSYFSNPRSPTREELSKMRTDIRRKYAEALGELTLGLLTNHITIDSTEMRSLLAARIEIANRARSE